MLRKNIQGREELKQKKRKTRGIVEAKPKRLEAWIARQSMWSEPSR